MKNRELKFRAWSHDRKKFITQFGPYKDYNLFQEKDAINGGLFCGGEQKNGDWEEPELSQFTGFKDKNGREIYENDLVKDSAPWVWIVRFGELVSDGITFVGWYMEHQEKFDYSGPFASEDQNVLEVVGNIYENPELIA